MLTKDAAAVVIVAFANLLEDEMGMIEFPLAIIRGASKVP
jgi:hypothetical protein